MQTNNNLNPLHAQGTLNGDTVAPAADGAAPDPAYVAKATKAAVEFESFFISHMLKEMRATTREMADEDSVFKDRVNQQPSIDALRRQAVSDGMRPLRLAGVLRVAEGLTTLDEVLAATPPVE